MDLYKDINFLKNENKLLKEQQQAQRSQIQELKLLIQKLNPQFTSNTETTISSILANFSYNFTGHGLSNLTSTNSATAHLTWLVCITLAFIFCFYNIATTFTDYFAYDVVSSSRVFYRKEMVFPALIVCAWNTESPLEKSIIFCQFNRRDCQLMLEFRTVIVVGNGASSRRNCIRFNGKNSKQKLLSVKKAGVLNGLVVYFLAPPNVSCKSI